MNERKVRKHRLLFSTVAVMLALFSLPQPSMHARTVPPHGTLNLHRHRPMPMVASAQPLPTPSQPETGQPVVPTPPAPNGGGPGGSGGVPGTPTNPQPLYRLSKLRVQVIDGRTMQPLRGAEVVLIETEQRLTTDANGWTQWFDAPVIRNPRYRPMVAELHGQLGVVAYKNGYRDSVHLGIRMHDGAPAQATVWMYKIGPGDRRIEPVLYQEPYHHLWLIDLADRFRSKTQIGEGFQRP